MSAIAGYFAFYGVGDNLLSGRGEPERLSGVPVSDNFFDVLGVHPILGRGFNAQECAWNGPKAVMLGLRSLAAPLQFRSGHRRHVADAERQAAHGGRRPARIVRLRVGIRARAAISICTSPSR